MKKIVSLVMAVMLCCVLIACGGEKDNTFSGKYTASTQEDIQAVQAKVEEAGIAGSEIDYNTGVAIEAVVKTSVMGESSKISMKMKCIMQDDMLVMQGSMKMKVSGLNIDANIWFANDMMYMSAMGEKMKMEMDINDYIAENVGAEVMDLASILEEYGQSTEIQYYTCETKDGITKIKIEVPATEEGSFVFYLVYNADYTLNAIKMETKMSTIGEEMEMTMSIKPWTGTVNLPNDLDSYVTMEY